MKQLSFIITLCFISHMLLAQGVGIGTPTPDPSAALEVSSVAQGMLVPRMTTAQRTAISNPATGLLVFDMTTNSFWFKGGSNWMELIDSSKTIIHNNGPDVFMAMSGNVGIGTNTPSTKLEVKTPSASLGITHNDGTIKISSLTTTLVGRFGTTTNHPFQLMANNGINQLTIMPTGNIGIGTATANHPLSFPNTTGNKISLSGTAGNNFGLGLGTGLLQVFADASTSNIGFGYGQSTSFTELVRMTGTGRLGIGTLNPSAMVEVVRGTAPDGNLFVRGTTHNTYFNQSTAEHTTINGGKNGSNILLNAAAGTGNVGIGTASPLQKLDVNGNVNISGGLAVGIGATFAAGIAVGAGITAGGAVGFGTTTPNPSAALDITSTTKGFLMPRMTSTQREAIPSPAEGLTVYDQSTHSPWYRTENNWKELKDSITQEVIRNGPDMIYMGLTDSVGVGTSTPQHKLQVKTGDAQYGISHTTGVVDIVTYASQSSGGRIGTKSNHPFKLFANNGTDQLVITPAGNIGIGVGSPQGSLEVARGSGINGTATFKGTNHNSVFNFSTDEHTYIRGGKAGSNIIMNDVAGLGNVGVGTATPLQKLHVEGNAYITQKVGIGTNTMNGSLQFANTAQNRKMVLWENANNDHQYIGLGGDAFTMRYQVGNTASNHIFYAGASASTSTEIMRIAGNGQVGIGVTPTNRLDVAKDLRTLSHPNNLALYVTADPANNIAEFRNSNGSEGIGITSTSVKSVGGTNQNLTLESKGPTGAVIITTNATQRVFVNGAGNVGIGTPNANAPLQFTNSFANRKIVLNEGANNDHQFAGIGYNALSLRYQVANAGENHVFYAGASSSSSNELMRLTGDGKLGIGVSNPTASLEVARGNGINGTAAFLGTENNSVFNFGTAEDTYLRGGKSTSNLYINDTGGNVGIGSTGFPLQKLQVAGNVFIMDKLGIGVAAPTAYLQVPNTEQNRKMVLWDDGNNEHQFNGFGGNPSELRYQVSSTNNAHVFYAATSSSNSTELMRVKGNGDVQVAGGVDVGGRVDMGYTIVTNAGVIPAFGSGGVTCNCPAGTKVLGGGWQGTDLDVIQSRPTDATGLGWYSSANNVLPTGNTLIVYAICARIGN